MPPQNDDQMAACPLLGCFGRLVAGSQPHPDDPGTISRGFGAYRGGFGHWGPWPPVRPSARPARNRPRTTPGPYHGDSGPYRAGSETGSPGRPSGLPRRPARNRRGPSLRSKINDFDIHLCCLFHKTWLPAFRGARLEVAPGRPRAHITGVRGHIAGVWVPRGTVLSP